LNRSRAIVTAIIVSLALTVLNAIAYVVNWNNLHSAYTLAFDTAARTDAATAHENSALLLYLRGLQELVFGHICFEVAIIIALLIALILIFQFSRSPLRAANL
jgi:hypothetical protein